MTFLAYNLSLVVGVTLIGVGVACQWGLPIAGIAVGALVIGLTVLGAVLGSLR
jgi:hypothetical protein